MADSCRACAEMPLLQQVPIDPIPYREPCPKCRARRVRQERSGALSPAQIAALESTIKEPQA